MKTLACCVGLIVLGAAPVAQGNPPAPDGSPPAAEAQEAQARAITVTGTLIHRTEVDSLSPVSVIDREMLLDAGITNVGDVLQKLPAQGNAVNAQNNGGDGSTRVNLRSLGTARTLVLLDGRRVVPSGLGADDSVDLGTLPLAMIERVEVLKDGDSTIYGSGAIAGVVNVITRTHMNGTEANVYTSTSNQADGTNYDLSFVTGHSSNRGNITFSGGYQNQKPVMASDRDFSRGGTILGGYLVTPSTRINLFSNGDYDITRNVHGFFEGQLNSRKSTQRFADPILTSRSIPISSQNFYNPFGQDVVDYNLSLAGLGPHIFDQNVNTTRLVVGLDGTIDEQVPALKNWKWEASYNYGRSDANQTTHGDLNLSHLRNALGPSIDATHCGAPGTPVAQAIPGCVPLDLLHPDSGAITQDAINYLTFTGTQSGFNEQHTALLTASGKLVDLPNHTDISLALGGDYRFERGGRQPDPLTATGDTGNASQPILGSYHTFEGFGELSIIPFANGETLQRVEFNAAGRVHDDNRFGSGATGKVSGLLHTRGGVAVRSSYGSVFRAPSISELFSGQADSFLLLEDPCDTLPPSKKAPITLPPTVAMQCANPGTKGGNVPAGSMFGTSQQRARFGGNPQLQPEKGTVGTAGLVYEPLHGLDVTLDYWHVDITDAITSLPPLIILSQCYQAANNNFCNLIERDPNTHAITHILDLNQNIGGVTTSGLDFSAAYQYQNNLGTFRHAFEGTYLFEYNRDTGTKDPSTMKESILSGRGVYDLGVLPDIKFNLFTTWIHPSGVGAGFNVRFIDSYQVCDQNNCNNPTSLRHDVSNYATGDLFVTYRRKTSQGTTSITAGMNNVLNAQPPTIYNGFVSNADASAYDFLGRQFYLRLSQLF